MSTRVYAQQNDTLDLLCQRHYGYTAGVTEQAYQSNPALAALGPILPLGTAVTLPSVQTQQQTPVTNLWD